MIRSEDLPCRKSAVLLLIREWMYALISNQYSYQIGRWFLSCSYLGCFNVVVEVIPEGLNVRNNIGHSLGCQVSRE